MANLAFWKASSLLNTTQQCLDQVEDRISNPGITLSDYLMSGFAIFCLKYPSLLQFDKNRNEELIQANLYLQALYCVEEAPSASIWQGLENTKRVNLI